MTFTEILNIGLMVLAFINICLAGYYRVVKNNTEEATFYLASVAVLYLIATR